MTASLLNIYTRRVPSDIARQLQSAGYHPALARLYAARGIRTPIQIESELTTLLTPDTLAGIDSATTLLYDAINQKNKIVIVADYDCDGATACAVGVRGLRMLGAHVDYLVPNRAIHGYGLTPEIVDEVHQQFAPQMIVTVDNGVASIDGVQHAQSLGIKVIITDHHLPAEQLPKADAIVNPNVPPCRFRSKNLAGVGVMFYVLLNLRQKMRAAGVFDRQTQPPLNSLLDLVALGTVADVVVLDDNNRILVKHGMTRIRQGRAHVGINALLRVSGRNPDTLSVADLGFAIGPRINAAGRLYDMRLGIECLLTDDLGRAWRLAQELDAVNIQRKEIESEMRAEAQIIMDGLNIEDRASICVYHPNWHQGVIGILASRLKDSYHRPSLVFANSSDTHLRASGRSVAQLHLRDALDLLSKQAPHVLEKFGGHAMAAGLTMRREHFDEFCKLFEDIVTAAKLPSDKSWLCDGELETAYHNLDFTFQLNQLVWGNGCAAPLFYGEFRVKQQKVLKDAHLKLLLEKGGQTIDAIWFGQNTFVADHLGVLYRLESNQYNGVSKVQLMVETAAAKDQIQLKVAP